MVDLPARERNWPLRIDELQFVVYVRRGCGCCKRAMAVLRSFQERHGFSINTIEVDSDPDLVKAYGESVPVVELNGKIRFRGLVNPVLLDRLIAAEAARLGGA